MTDDRDDAIREYRDEFARETALGRIVGPEIGMEPVETDEEEDEDAEPERVPYTEEEIVDRERSAFRANSSQEEKDADRPCQGTDATASI